MDKAKATVYLATDRAHVVRETIRCCRKGGTISMPGVYFGFLDKIPMGAFMNKGLTLKTGQTHRKRYTQPLLDKIEAGRDRSLLCYYPQRAAGRRSIIM
ncbi:MAG TPA: hypothetical protein VGI85_00985 [Chthoniobacterales bacterium]|jgi:threonine dehydrogenase-like Zn-dependent dehydrogenase